MGSKEAVFGDDHGELKQSDRWFLDAAGTRGLFHSCTGRLITLSRAHPDLLQN